MGPKSHVLTFPIAQGKTFNLVAFQTDEGEWPSSEKLTLPAHKADALREFQNFGPAVLRELELTNEDIDRVRFPSSLSKGEQFNISPRSSRISNRVSYWVGVERLWARYRIIC